MRVYLDNYCFNRLFDDQRQIRAFLETQAKLHIQEQIKNEKISLSQCSIVAKYFFIMNNQKPTVILFHKLGLIINIKFKFTV